MTALLDTVAVFSVPPTVGWLGTKPAPALGLFPVGATLAALRHTEYAYY